ncbi:MAG: PfkB family carbohydrate kinase [Euryarchaeota archaeon]|nr:PfkB family carbohydrate kinase [Euryarchaeota archaeon]
MIAFIIPPVKAETRDPTGAGDSFVGGFIGEYLKTKDIKRAGLVGSVAASFVIEDYGPFNFPKSPNEIFKRLRSQNIAF